ncbi:MAG: homocysteine S-methyltransferase family protein [Lachnospiraceae bacterium]|nr:homocysteine S-methyltransferase family protein [Lachnospiraceae bacterium]
MLTKERFRHLAENNLMILDGAMGSNLQKAGMKTGVCPDMWISEHTEVVIKLQQDYLKAGTRILYAPTFTANRIKLMEFSLEGSLDIMNSVLVNISKEAINRFNEDHPGEECYVAGDLTMTGLQLEPLGPMNFEKLIDIYKEQIRALVRAGVDLLVIETMMSLQESRAAVIAAKEEAPDLPLMATMTFEADGRTLYGTDPVTALITLQALGVDAFGANCSTGPDAMVSMIKEMKKVATVPLICKPNAGMPTLDENGNSVYDLSSDEFARDMIKIVEAGANIIGGCCGTDPEYIEKTVKATKDIKVLPVADTLKEGEYFLTSERYTKHFKIGDPFFVIGERINPTGKKDLQEELREECFDTVIEFAESQEDAGAGILDVNMGMSGVDEKALMLKAVEELTMASKLPLSIDTSHVDIMEAALRRYPGRALINSISLESSKCKPMLKLAKKYGAAFILLPLSDEGLPKSAEEKKENIHKILEAAYKEGLGKNDIIVDGLVGTVGANRMAGRETAETVRYCSEELHLATVCGLSNISFGLPERIVVNTAFLTMLISAGLSTAIANPGQEMLINAAYAADLLNGKENADVRYIEHINAYKEKHAGEKTVKEIPEVKQEIKDNGGAEGSVEDELYMAVLKGSRSTVEELTKKALDDGRLAQDILNESLLTAINEVGALYDKGTYFLPQLISSGEAMKKAINILEPYLKEAGENAGRRPTIVIATVKGDIHDIGKNLVSLMLKNHGFNVVDLGKDVPREEITEAALKDKADIIALSALMTTTMTEMKEVIKYAREQGYKGAFMVGGAVVSPEYAKEIEAHYSSDAADAVKVAKSII